MGNFEKLSVVVIVVIIVMILAVAVVEWTSGPSEAPATEPATAEKAEAPPVLPVEPVKTEKVKGKPAVNKQAPAVESDPFAADPWGPSWDPKAGGAADKTEPKPLAAGDKPVTPAPAVTPAPGPTTVDIPETTYVVKEGDMLSTIAKTVYGKASDWPRIAEANPGIRPESLRKGDTLKIPAKKGVTMSASPSPGTSGGTKPTPGQEYTVQANDTWERIALAAYNTSSRWPEIYVKNINRVSGMKDLPKGKVLMIPK